MASHLSAKAIQRNAETEQGIAVIKTDQMTGVRLY